MLLNKLFMRNFKRFRDQEITFQDGITGIVGNNGTGKSSIVSAILFALYGLQGTGVDGNYIVSSSAGPQDVCEVRLDFLAGGNEYTVIRKFKRRPSSSLHEASLYLNQKLLANSVQKVAQEMQRIVGMGPGDFRNTIYAGQKELLTLIESRAGSRKDWFMQVLGIDYLKKDSMEALKEIIDVREKGYQEISGRLQELDVDRVRTRIKALQAELAGAEEEAKKSAAAEKSAEEMLERTREERDHLLHVRDSYLRLIREEEVLTAEVARLSTECQEERAEITERMRLQDDIDAIAPLAGRYETLKAEVARMTDEKVRADQLAVAASTAREQEQEYDGRYSNIAEELAALVRDEESVTGLARDVEEWQALRNRIAALKDQQMEYNTLREDLARMEERFTLTEQHALKNRTDIEKVEEKARHLVALEAEIGEYDALRTRDEILVRAAGYAREEERCRREARTASEEVSRLEEEIARLAGELAGIGLIEGEIGAAEDRRDDLTSQISACNARRESIREEIQELTEHRTRILETGPEGSCPMCHQDLGEHYEDLLDDLAAEIRSMQQTLAGLDNEHAQAIAAHKEVVTYIQDLVRQRTDLQHIKEQHALYTSRHEQSAGVAQRWDGEAGEHRAAIQALGLEGYDPAAHETLRKRLHDLEEKRTKADTLRGECSRLPSLREERQRLIAEVEDHLVWKEETEGKLARLGFDPQTLKRLEGEVDALETSYRAYTQAQTRLARRPALEAEQIEILKRLEGFRAGLQEIADEQAKLAFDPDRFLRLAEECNRAESAHKKTFEIRVRLEEVPRMQRALEAKQELFAGQKTALSTIKAALADLGFDERAVVAVERNLSEIEQGLTEARERRYAISAAIDNQKADIDKESARLIRADDLAREQKILYEEIGRLKLTRSLIKDYTDYLLQVVRDRIEEEAGRVLAEITDGRYGTVMLDDDFTVLVHDMGDDYPADRFSGGEQDDIAIALRIALSRFLAGVNEVHDSTFLIFDEIFGSQDEERRSNLLRALRTQEAHFPQILLISHITEVQDEFSTTLLVEMGADRASTVREFE